MSINKYDNFLIIETEDDANRQILNGFMKGVGLNIRKIQLSNHCSGWSSVINKFESKMISYLNEYQKGYVIMVIDFDDHYDERKRMIEEKIPSNLYNRVFVLGAKKEPEDLKRNLGLNYEAIGEKMADGFLDNNHQLWECEDLKHNLEELHRACIQIRSFIYA